MAKPSNAYTTLTHHLRATRRRDLLLPLREARDGLAAIAPLIDAAQRDAAPRAVVVWLEVEAMRRRARFQHVVHRIVETISDEPDGGDLVGSLLGGDGNRLLADVLLGER